MTRSTHHANRCPARILVAVAVLGAGALVPACGGTTTDEDVVRVGSALNLSLPGRGSGLLWRASNGDLNVWDMMSSTNYKEVFLATANPTVWQPVATGDFNGDGAGDIFWRDAADAQLSIWLLTDTQVTGLPPGTTNSPNLAQLGKPFAGDLDGDGVSDLVWNGTINGGPAGTIYVALSWLMNAGSTVPRSTSSFSSANPVQGVGDFDNDSLHRADIVFRSPTTGSVSIQFNGAPGQSTIGSASTDWQIKGIGDFNGDHFADLLWYNVNSGQVFIWAMQGTTAVANVSPGTSPPASGWTIQGVADVDRDGVSDIIWRHSSGLVSIWMMTDPATVREFGPTIVVPTTTTFAGVVELGPPPQPTNLTVATEVIQNGRTNINFTFTAPRPSEQVEIWESFGGTVELQAEGAVRAEQRHDQAGHGGQLGVSGGRARLLSGQAVGAGEGVGAVLEPGLRARLARARGGDRLADAGHVRGRRRRRRRRRCHALGQRSRRDPDATVPCCPGRLRLIRSRASAGDAIHVEPRQSSTGPQAGRSIEMQDADHAAARRFGFRHADHQHPGWPDGDDDEDGDRTELPHRLDR